MGWEQLWGEEKHEILEKIRKATPHQRNSRKNGLSIEDFANFLELSPRHALEFLEFIQERGANVFTRNGHILTKPILSITRWTYDDVIPPSKFEIFGQKITGYRFGVISDTHFGSYRTNREVLEAAYQHFADQGIKHVLHLGNVLAGKAKQAYREADREISDLEGQVALLERAFPKRKGITTHFLVGHTDRTFQKDNINPAMHITDARSDFNYLGVIEADLVFNPKRKKPFRIRVYNEKLFYYYGISYQAQKKVENLAGGDKPAIWLIGGTQQEWSSRYQGVEVRKFPGLQHQTMQMRDRAYLCNVGFNVLSIVPTEKRPLLYTHVLPDMNPGPEPASIQRKAA